MMLQNFRVFLAVALLLSPLSDVWASHAGDLFEHLCACTVTKGEYGGSVISVSVEVYVEASPLCKDAWKERSPRYFDSIYVVSREEPSRTTLLEMAIPKATEAFGEGLRFGVMVVNHHDTPISGHRDPRVVGICGFVECGFKDVTPPVNIVALDWLVAQQLPGFKAWRDPPSAE